MSVEALPRLKLTEIDPNLATYLAPTVDRLGYFGEFFQITAHAPDALLRFMEYTGAVKACLSDNLNEAIALTVCTLLGAEYERVQHERLALRLGLSEEWIAELVGRSVGGVGHLRPDEAAVQRLAIATIARGGRDIDTELSRVTELLGPRRAVAAMLQITRFQMIAVVCNAFKLPPPVPSIFASDDTVGARSGAVAP